MVVLGGVRFLMGEVPMYEPTRHLWDSHKVVLGGALLLMNVVQGYLAYPLSGQ